jgi:putative membrane protein
MQRAATIFYIWILIFACGLIWSGINPKDQFTWFLEVAPAMAGAIVMLVTYRSFRLSPLLYVLILVHCLILMVGGHYTYAEVPLFDTFKTLFGFERNNYDKVGHFAQGFVPALIARELLIRKAAVNGRHWLNLFVVSFALAFSAFYELIEWVVAIASGEDAEAFLGTQGYVWDTQSDMALALLGAVVAVLSLARLHDRQLKHLMPSASANGDQTSL